MPLGGLRQMTAEGCAALPGVLAGADQGDIGAQAGALMTTIAARVLHDRLEAAGQHDEAVAVMAAMRAARHWPDVEYIAAFRNHELARLIETFGPAAQAATPSMAARLERGVAEARSILTRRAEIAGDVVARAMLDRLSSSSA
jgi:hypothetical protein